MPEITGIIKDIRFKETSGGVKLGIVVLKSGDIFTTFETEMLSELEAGLGSEVKINYSVSEDGKYKNIQGIEILKQVKQEKGIHLTDENIRLKAFELAGKYEQDLNKAIELANKIVNWVKTGDWFGEL